MTTYNEISRIPLLSRLIQFILASDNNKVRARLRTPKLKGHILSTRELSSTSRTEDSETGDGRFGSWEQVVRSTCARVRYPAAYVNLPILRALGGSSLESAFYYTGIDRLT